MFEQPVIEPARFARSNAQLAGTLEAAGLSRLADLVFDGAGSVRYAVSGYVSERGYSALHVVLDGELRLRCQRCLGLVVQPVHSQRDIVLVPGADEFAPLEDESESEDVIPDVRRLELGPLLEEELLLALPLAIRHEEGACSTGIEPAQAAAPSPFAALAKFKQ